MSNFFIIGSIVGIILLAGLVKRLMTPRPIIYVQVVKRLPETPQDTVHTSGCAPIIVAGIAIFLMFLLLNG